MSSNIISWEIIQMSNRRPQAQQRSILRRRTTTTPQQALNLQRYHRPLIGAHRPSIMVPVLRRGTDSLHLNNNRFFIVTLQGGLFSGHGGSLQASRYPPHFVTALAIRRSLRRMSQNNSATISAYGRLRAFCLPPTPPAQNRPAPPPPLNSTVVINERMRSQEPSPPPAAADNTVVVNERVRSRTCSK